MKNIEIREDVFNELKKIKKGEVKTYKDIAKKVNSSPRAVAKIISTNKNPINIPCHRVIRSNGEIGGYTYNGKQNVQKKVELLKSEGITIRKNKVIFN